MARLRSARLTTSRDTMRNTTALNSGRNTESPIRTDGIRLSGKSTAESGQNEFVDKLRVTNGSDPRRNVAAQTMIGRYLKRRLRLLITSRVSVSASVRSPSPLGIGIIRGQFAGGDLLAMLGHQLDLISLSWNNEPGVDVLRSSRRRKSTPLVLEKCRNVGARLAARTERFFGSAANERHERTGNHVA